MQRLSFWAYFMEIYMREYCLLKSTQNLISYSLEDILLFKHFTFYPIFLFLASVQAPAIPLNFFCALFTKKFDLIQYFDNQKIKNRIVTARK